ncbi:SGNH/GDSL hydrolase family protein [Chitinophaga sp. MM2321]|uniref:SGNH/GDSL hydrolase family protein n=1 Tax=Chitinophaga sp. MM2321 TaxID=3137178 RepID=UPI0032D58BAE
MNQHRVWRQTNYQNMSNQYSRRTFLQMSSFAAILPGMLSSVAPGPELEILKALFKKEDPVLWLFAGDSVTQGAHHTYGHRCYPEIFAERVRWEMRRITDIVVNSGVNGTNTSYLSGAFDWLVGKFKPSVVSVMFGINDCQVKEITPAVFEQNLEQIIEKIRALKAIPLLQTPNGIDQNGVAHMKTASRARLPEYVEIIRKVAANKSVILIDNWQYWNNGGLDHFKNWLDDPMHPNAEGHTQIARLIFRELSIFDMEAFTCSGKK